MSEQFDRPYDARLTIRTAPDGGPSILLNDTEISGLVRAEGFKIEPDTSEFNPGGWVVTMVFGAGKHEALDLDIDLETLRGLLAAREAEVADCCRDEASS